MRFDHMTVAELAESVEAAPSKLLTTSNPKTDKSRKFGYLTAILHLAPATASGAELCSYRTDGCTIACLTTAGRGGFDATIQRARVRKSKWFRADKQAFMAQLERELAAHILRAERQGLLPAVRLNGTSDIPWESVRFTLADGSRGTIFDAFPSVQFYDYTKNPTRFKASLPANYDLTFSLADGNRRAADIVMRNGGRVAVVFRNADKPRARAAKWTLPASWDDRAIVDADKHDLRFLDPAGVWCGLKAKGLATVDSSGFVNDIAPAV